MSKLHKSLFILLLLTITACKSSLNGQYLIYKTETVPTYGLVSGIDYDASEKMCTLFKGKKYNLQFTPKYATLREENSNEDLILDNISNEKEDSKYELTYTKNREKVKLTLYDKSESDSKDVTMFITIYEQLTDSIGQTIGGHGLIRCFLTKPTN